MFPANPAPLRTYYDPTLWDRLAPAILEHITEKSRHMLDGHWKSLEEAREMIGYLRGLQWVLDMAGELTKAEET